MHGSAVRAAALLRAATGAVELKEKTNSIGRGPRCAVKLDLPGVSRAHAEIVLGEDGRNAAVRDLGSSNGTFINGERVAKEFVPLQHGDVLHFSAYEPTSFTFEFTDPDAGNSNMTMQGGSVVGGLPPAKMPIISGGHCMSKERRSSPDTDDLPTNRGKLWHPQSAVAIPSANADSVRNPSLQQAPTCLREASPVPKVAEAALLDAADLLKTLRDRLGRVAISVGVNGEFDEEPPVKDSVDDPEDTLGDLIRKCDTLIRHGICDQVQHLERALSQSAHADLVCPSKCELERLAAEEAELREELRSARQGGARTEGEAIKTDAMVAGSTRHDVEIERLESLASTLRQRFVDFEAAEPRERTKQIPENITSELARLQDLVSSRDSLSRDESAMILRALLRAERGVAELCRREVACNRKWAALAEEGKLLKDSNKSNLATLRKLKRRRSEILAAISAKRCDVWAEAVTATQGTGDAAQRDAAKRVHHELETLQHEMQGMQAQIADQHEVISTSNAKREAARQRQQLLERVLKATSSSDHAERSERHCDQDTAQMHTDETTVDEIVAAEVENELLQWRLFRAEERERSMMQDKAQAEARRQKHEAESQRMPGQSSLLQTPGSGISSPLAVREEASAHAPGTDVPNARTESEKGDAAENRNPARAHARPAALERRLAMSPAARRQHERERSASLGRRGKGRGRGHKASVAFAQPEAVPINSSSRGDESNTVSDSTFASHPSLPTSPQSGQRAHANGDSTSDVKLRSGTSTPDMGIDDPIGVPLQIRDHSSMEGPSAFWSHSYTGQTSESTAFVPSDSLRHMISFPDSTSSALSRGSNDAQLVPEFGSFAAAERLQPSSGLSFSKPKGGPVPVVTLEFAEDD